MNKKARKKRGKIYPFEKKSLALFVFALLIFSFLILTINFQQENSITGKAITLKIGGDESNNNNNNNSKQFGFGGIETNIKIAQYIVFLIIAMVLFWVSDSITQGKKSLKAILALLIAYLFVAFIRLDQLYSLMAVYSAAGATITVAIPLIVISLLNAKLVSSGILTLGKVLIQKVIWIVFSIFLIYYIFFTMTLSAFKSEPVLSLIIFVFALIAIFFTIFNSHFIKMIRRLGKKINEANEKAKNEEALRIAAHERNAKLVNELRKKLDSEKELKRQLERKEKDIQNLVGETTKWGKLS